MTLGGPTPASVRGRSAFALLRSGGVRVRSGMLRATVRRDRVVDRGQAGVFVAFALGRRMGSAVVRNRARRRIREALRYVLLSASDYGQSVETASTSPHMVLSDIADDERVLLLVHGHPGLIDRDFAALCRDWLGVLEHVAALPGPGATDSVPSEEVTGRSADGRSPLAAGGAR